MIEEVGTTNFLGLQIDYNQVGKNTLSILPSD
jgi:hypothetical protein